MLGLATFSVAPVIKIDPGATDEERRRVEIATSIINSALPHDKRIKIASDYNNLNEEGTIQITFNRNFPRNHPLLGHAKVTSYWQTPATGDKKDKLVKLVTSMVEMRPNAFVKPTFGDPGRAMIQVLIHEIMHALGIWGHIDNTSSLMGTYYAYNSRPMFLYPIDSDILLAMYGVLPTGLQPDEFDANSLGSWSNTSSHLVGEFSWQQGTTTTTASFGVAYANGLARPWATGPKPGSALSANTDLSTTVTWNGALLGYTPTADEVVGKASLAVEISSLTGNLNFTELKDFSDQQWKDGDLGYMVVVEENFFRRTGGDDGNLRGTFVGSKHEGMVGVLERSDLAAGFGGKR